MKYQPPAHSALNIIYQDNYLLIINKPHGLLSVPGRGEDKQDCFISRIQQEFPDALIVHRLDMSTSGLMIIALGKEAERDLSILFQKRKVIKKYIAVIDGKVKEKYGEINLPLITDWPNRPKQMVDFKNGKNAQTQYRVIDYDKMKDVSRVELTPITGRTHQLRIHLKCIDHSILGDNLYASTETIKKSDRLLLHASHLSFLHPYDDDKTINVTSAPTF